MLQATVTVTVRTSSSSGCRNSYFAIRHSSDTYIAIGIAVSNFVAKELSLSSNTTGSNFMIFYVGEFQSVIILVEIGKGVLFLHKFRVKFLGKFCVIGLITLGNGRKRPWVLGLLYSSTL